ncbi:hypothetical protein [Burkholderia ubonensis]|uniref:hypothetical protein n=1 Tax=Burkholderia ubonensis TaxID=101571 RepID=UPI0012F8CD9D|nr:hypothetical protein [Burkholderia ubonensis]
MNPKPIADSFPRVPRKSAINLCFAVDHAKAVAFDAAREASGAKIDRSAAALETLSLWVHQYPRFAHQIASISQQPNPAKPASGRA